MSLPSAGTPGWGTLASFWWAAEYLGLGSKTLGLESWKPGGLGEWQAAGGWGVAQAGEGVIFSGNCRFSGQGAEDTHVPCHKLTYMYTHASTHVLCMCEHGWRRLKAEDL